MNIWKDTRIVIQIRNNKYSHSKKWGQYLNFLIRSHNNAQLNRLSSILKRNFQNCYQSISQSSFFQSHARQIMITCRHFDVFSRDRLAMQVITEIFTINCACSLTFIINNSKWLWVDVKWNWMLSWYLLS